MEQKFPIRNVENFGSYLHHRKLSSFYENSEQPKIVISNFWFALVWKIKVVRCQTTIKEIAATC